MESAGTGRDGIEMDGNGKWRWKEVVVASVRSAVTEEQIDMHKQLDYYQSSISSIISRTRPNIAQHYQYHQ